jgi:hypothetical protein
LQFYYACTVCRSPPRCKVLEFECFLGDRMTRRELIAFAVRSSGSTSRNEKRAQALAIGTREDIIMLDKAPNGKVTDLLNALDKALSAGEVEHAVDLFQADCYWRDLVTFTWNIKTMEGKDQVRDMLKGRLADTKPSNWKIADGEDASEADGITESWIQFETEVARGFGHMRLKIRSALAVVIPDWTACSSASSPSDHL